MKNIFCEMHLRRLRNLKKKDVSFEMFLRSLWNISLNRYLIDTPEKHFISAWLDMKPLLGQSIQQYLKLCCISLYLIYQLFVQKSAKSLFYFSTIRKYDFLFNQSNYIWYNSFAGKKGVIVFQNMLFAIC